MRNTKSFVILLSVVCLCIHLTNCSKDTKKVHAKVYSCAGCSLNRLTEVKKFIYEDLPNYKNTEFIKVPGATPELCFYDEKETEVERINLSSLNRKECNELLINNGFIKKEAGKHEF